MKRVDKKGLFSQKIMRGRSGRSSLFAKSRYSPDTVSPSYNAAGAEVVTLRARNFLFFSFLLLFFRQKK